MREPKQPPCPPPPPDPELSPEVRAFLDDYARMCAELFIAGYVPAPPEGPVS